MSDSMHSLLAATPLIDAYCQRRGLLPLQDRSDGGIGHYGPPAPMRLRFVGCTQSLGFSLDDAQAPL